MHEVILPVLVLWQVFYEVLGLAAIMTSMKNWPFRDFLEKLVGTLECVLGGGSGIFKI